MEIVAKIIASRVAQLMIVGGVGLMLGMLANPDSSLHHQILYVSQEEIMELEQERIKNEDLPNRQMFFGRIDEAVGLATTLPKAYENRNTSLVYSSGSVSGKNVKSVSKEVHQEIISRLVALQSNGKNSQNSKKQP